MLSSLNLPRATPGRCRYCKCTDQRACPEGCSWYDDCATVCSSAVCVARFRLALAGAMKKLLHIGLQKQKTRALSCYHEAAVIIENLRAELAVDAAHAKTEAQEA